MRCLVLAFCALLALGCALSKEESTIARAQDAVKNKKKELPSGFFTENQVGVKYYPGADAVQSRQYDEGGFHILEVILTTTDSTDKVRDFYEKELAAKAMPVPPIGFSIQKNDGPKHYQIDYARFDSDTNITIKVTWPTG